MSNLNWKSFGFSESQSETAQQLGNLHSAEECEDYWRRLCRALVDDFPSPSACKNAWDAVFEHWDSAKRPAPMYSPDLAEIQRSNIAIWSSEIGIMDYAEFHKWSTSKPQEFWQQATERLEIPFFHRGSTILSDEDDPTQATWFPDSKMNISASCFLADSNAPAIIYQAPTGPLQRISYDELKSQANRISNSLVNRGFKTGDAIAVVLPMTAESVAIYLGIVQAGMCVVSIADSFAATEIANRLRIADAKAVFTYDAMSRAGKAIALYERVQQATQIPTIVLPLNRETIDIKIRSNDTSFGDFLVDSEQFEAIECQANDCVNILFSSGTTGDPKAIPWSHLTPIKCAIDGMIHQNIASGTVAAWPTNLGWMMGPWLIFATLINRGTIALYEDVPMGEGFGKFIQDAKVNMLGVVPTIVKAWRSNQCMEPFDWTSIECFSSTGEASQADDMFYLSAMAGMRPMIEYCGGTEIGGGYISATVVQPNVAGAFSTPAIGLDFEILNGENEPDDEGEVFLRGPSIGLSNRLLNRDHFETYFEGTPIASDGRQLRRHGDHVKKLAGGYYIAGGRSDDTMNLGGIKVSSAEIERVLNQLDAIKETAAIAYSDGGPDQLIVFSVLQTDKDIDVKDLQSEMNDQLKNFLNPLFKVSQVRVTPALPRTASNKVMRRSLRDQIDQ